MIDREASRQAENINWDEVSTEYCIHYGIVGILVRYSRTQTSSAYDDRPGEQQDQV